jgi:hypothetical protein
VIRTNIATAAAALALCTIGSAAWAQTAHRAWVSGRGTDAAGCGAPTAPCRSLQYAHDTIVAPGGEIDILDPAGYGAINITKAISIVNDGVGTAGVQEGMVGQIAISINAGDGDSIFLRGLNIDGENGIGQDGIAFNSGASLIVDHCVVRHFSAEGIFVGQRTASSTFAVYDSVLSNNGGSGLLVSQSGFDAIAVSGQLDRVSAIGNGASNQGSGVSVLSSDASASTKVIISYSDVSGNNGSGLVVNAQLSANVEVEVNDTTIGNNSLDGLIAENLSKTHLARDILDENGQYGIENMVSVEGNIFSAGDNHVSGNGSAQLHGASLFNEALY